MKKTDEMKKFEKETGKKAIWNGKITNAYKNWRDGKKIYNRNKKRLSLYISEDNKHKWKTYIDSNRHMKGFSGLIRISVEEYLKNQANFKTNDFNIPKISHDLKEPLTIIKASSQLLLESFGTQLTHDSLELIKNIFESSIMLENKIKHSLDRNTGNDHYDVLIIDDYYLTIQILTKYFNSHGYKCKVALSGEQGINLLEGGMPKLILLDIVLPDMPGYEVCKIIKSKSKYENVKVFYMTGIPSSEIENKIRNTGAEGYFLKPFDLTDLHCLFDILNNRSENKLSDYCQ